MMSWYFPHQIHYLCNGKDGRRDVGNIEIEVAKWSWSRTEEWCKWAEQNHAHPTQQNDHRGWKFQSLEEDPE
jgi:hypothetical protein